MLSWVRERKKRLDWDLPVALAWHPAINQRWSIHHHSLIGSVIRLGYRVVEGRSYEKTFAVLKPISSYGWQNTEDGKLPTSNPMELGRSSLRIPLSWSVLLKRVSIEKLYPHIQIASSIEPHNVGGHQDSLKLSKHYYLLALWMRNGINQSI